MSTSAAADTSNRQDNPPNSAIDPVNVPQSANEESAIHNLIALVFSRTALNPEQWSQRATDVVLGLQEALGLHKTSTSSPARYLDTNPQHSGGRVVELTIPLLYKTAEADKASSSPITLTQCAATCNSPVITTLQADTSIELVLLPQGLYKSFSSKPGLAVFDMDSTLIQQEVIDELARKVGLYDQVSAITEAAMRGEAPYTDFEASLRARVGCLKGVPISVWEDLKRGTITFTPGAAELVQVLKRCGWKTAVLSGGFTPLANWVKDTLGLDYAYANHLVNDEAQGVLTGELVEGKPIIHAEKKRELLLQLAADNGLSAEQCIAVGDGSNDLLMMHAAGLGIAFNAKPKVQLAAPTRLNSRSLLDVLFVLGHTGEEVQALIAGK